MLTFANVYTSSVWCSIFVSCAMAEWFVAGMTEGQAKRAGRRDGKRTGSTAA